MSLPTLTEVLTALNETTAALHGTTIGGKVQRSEGEARAAQRRLLTLGASLARSGLPTDPAEVEHICRLIDTGRGLVSYGLEPRFHKTVFQKVKEAVSARPKAATPSSSAGSGTAGTATPKKP